MALGDPERVAVNEQDVGATGLLDVGAGLGVQVEIVGIALGVGLDGGLEAHGVVQAGLDVAGAVRCGAVVVGDAQLDGLEATLVVGAHRRHEDAEGVLGRGGDADDVAGADHERADVERGAGAKGRNPRGVGLDDLLDGLNEAVLGEGRHLEALGGVEHALGVLVRTEADDVAALGGVGLEALEDLLAVVEDAAALGDVHGVVGGQAALVPLAVLPVGLVAVVGLHVAEAKAAPVQILLLNCHCMLSLRTFRSFALGKRLGTQSRPFRVRGG